jgi:hypothetical protein
VDSSANESSFFLPRRDVKSDGEGYLYTSGHFKSYLEISRNMHNCTDVGPEYP